MSKDFGMVNPYNYNGLPLNEAESIAKERGFTTRIVEIDGVSLMLTMDLKNNRINFRVKNNLVIDTYTG